MKHVIIGTAGHVDHGKTALIKALTGEDLDRLQEEKKRGITIELGFSHLDFPDGLQAGIVDVPGHEKFIKNMLAGAGGMDLAMLVVAADEGFMPQTVEHLQILTLLGVRRGLIALTKTDLVDAEWQNLMLQEIKNQIKGSFLENQPVIPVSVVDGTGVEALREALHAMALETPEKDRRIPFRLPIDRVFTVAGFGTVVTGTLMEGVIHAEDEASLLPSQQSARVRSLQVHGSAVESAYAGQRVAVNLPGIARETIRRGEILCKPGSMEPSFLLDVRLKNGRDSGRTIVNGSRVHLHLGAGAYVAKAVLLNQEKLEPGQEGYAQLRLSEPVAAKRGDPFVIRFFSPVETIGGGVILDAEPRKHKHGDQKTVSALKILEIGSEEEKLLHKVKKNGWNLPDANTLEAAPEVLQELCSRGKLAEPLPGRYLSAELMEPLRIRCTEALQQYHRQYPLRAGMSTAELRQKLLPEVPLQTANGVLRLLEEQGSLRREGEQLADPAFAVHLSHRQQRLRDQLRETYKAAGWKLPAAEEIVRQFDPKDREDCRQVLDSLLVSGELVRLSAQQFCHRSWLLQAQQMVVELLQQGSVTLGTFRDRLGTSRDTALLFLEYFDRQQLTVRQENIRIPGPSFP